MLKFFPSKIPARKLAQLLLKRLQEDRHASSIAIIQETYPEDFPCLLRVSGRAKRKDMAKE